MRTSLKSGRRDATVLAGSGQKDKRSALLVREQTDRRSAFPSEWTDRQEVSIASERQADRRSALLVRELTDRRSALLVRELTDRRSFAI